MKEPCEKCGKRFDMEECMYICPSCGHYHSQVNQYQYRKSRASGTGRQNASGIFHADSRPSVYKKQACESSRSARKLFSPEKKKRISFSSAPDKASKGKFRGAAVESGTSSKAKRILCLILLFLIVGFPIFYHMKTSMQMEQIRQTQESAEVNEVFVSSRSPVKLIDADLTLGEFTPFTRSGITAAPEGWKYMQLTYKTANNDSEYRSLDTSVTLKAGDTYYRSLDPYSLSESESVRDELYDLGVGSYSPYQEDGLWVFLIPEDTKGCTLRISQGERSSDPPYSLSAPEEAILIKLNAGGAEHA